MGRIGADEIDSRTHCRLASSCGNVVFSAWLEVPHPQGGLSMPASPETLARYGAAYSLLQADGISCQQIADTLAVSASWVYRCVRAAKSAPKILRGKVPREFVPLFGCLPFAPGSICAHKGLIRRGSRWYCPVCHASGFDGHPALTPPRLTRRRMPKDDGLKGGVG